MPDVAGNTNFGTNANKLVTITANTGANRVYVYNANNRSDRVPQVAGQHQRRLHSYLQDVPAHRLGGDRPDPLTAAPIPQ